MKPGSILIGCLLLIVGCKHSGDNIEVATPLKDFSAPFYFGLFELPPDNPLTQEGVELGCMLFYETKLSKDSTISCATCHQQSRAFTDGRKLGIGIRGQELDRNSMSLVNMLWSTSHKFWDGRAANLEDQVWQPIENPKEMDLKINEALNRLNGNPEYKAKFKSAFNTNKIQKEHVAKALAQFQRTLISKDSKYLDARARIKRRRVELKKLQQQEYGL